MSKLERIFIAIIVIFGIIVFAHDRYLANKLANQPIQGQPDKPISIVAKPISTYTDSAGRKHVVINSNANIIKEAKGNITNSLGGLDTVVQALNKAGKKIDKITQVNIELSQENIVLKAERDTLKKRLVYNYKDKNLDFTATKQDTSDNLLASYKINTDLNWIDYSKRSWFLGAKKQYTDIFSNDVNVSIKGVNRVTIQHAASDFGLRVRLSSTFNPVTGLATFGPSLEVDIKRFDIGTYYYYNPRTAMWTPSIRFDYSLFSF